MYNLRRGLEQSGLFGAVSDTGFDIATGTFRCGGTYELSTASLAYLPAAAGGAQSSSAIPDMPESSVSAFTRASQRPAASPRLSRGTSLTSIFSAPPTVVRRTALRGRGQGW